MPVDPRNPEPLWRQLAGHLRARILSGELPPGTALPSRSELMAEHQVSSTVTVKALDVLRAEGLIWGATGRGVYVREIPPTRVVSSARYRGVLNALRTGQTLDDFGFAARHSIGWDQVTVDTRFGDVEVPADIAVMFHVKPGARLFQRHMVLRAKERAEEIRIGWYPLRMRDLPFGDPTRQPTPGGEFAELVQAGVQFRELVERLSLRPATPDEAGTLRLPNGWVLTVTRTVHDPTGEPVAVERITYPAERTVLEYRIDLEGA